jgi:GTP cyclohydrolase I
MPSGQDSIVREPGELRGLSGTGDLSISALIRILLEQLGEDPDRPGLSRTPSRVEASFEELTAGMNQNVRDVVGEGVFEEDCSEMVIVKDVEFYSLCEHHLLPFYGKVHVAYIPDGRIIGLSKIPRVVDVFARRLQVQERLTSQVATAIQEVLEPKGVGVVIEAVHLCMMMRGVAKQNSSAMTSCLEGSFRSDPRTRSEFLDLVRRF